MPYFIPCSTVIAHAGDGNFHTVILFDPSKEEDRQEAERLNRFMVHTALSMEGTYDIWLFLLIETTGCGVQYLLITCSCLVGRKGI